MKRWAWLWLVIIGIMVWGMTKMRDDQLDTLADRAAKFRAAMAGSYQFQAQGALITLSHDNKCLLVLNQIHPDVAWYKQGKEAFLHTQLTGVKELNEYWQSHHQSHVVLTYADMPQADTGLRIALERLIDMRIEESRLIWEIQPISSSIQSCPHMTLHEVMGVGY